MTKMEENDYMKLAFIRRCHVLTAHQVACTRLKEQNSIFNGEIDHNLIEILLFLSRLAYF